MTLTTSRRATTILVSAVAIAVLAGTAAYAVWSTSGTGSGTAGATSSQGLTVSSAASVSGLYPTATNVSGGSITVSNPNPFKVAITTPLTFGVTSVSGNSSTCTASTVSFTAGTPSPTVIPAKSGSTNGTATIPYTASMTNAAEDGCQGATFTASLTVNATSAP